MKHESYKMGERLLTRNINKKFLHEFLQFFKSDIRMSDVPCLRKQSLLSITFKINCLLAILPFYAVQPKQPTESFK
jgi:hypothetical protein